MEIAKKRQQEKEEKIAMADALKGIEKGETVPDPKRLLRDSIESKLLASLTTIDSVKWRHLFFQCKGKGVTLSLSFQCLAK